MSKRHVLHEIAQLGTEPRPCTERAENPIHDSVGRILRNPTRAVNRRKDVIYYCTFKLICTDLHR